jgi:hypothetical protein
MKYRTGRDVRLGDRIRLWQGELGTVVCSIDTGEFTSEYPEAEWGYLKSGVMVRADNGGLFHYRETDEDFEPLPSSDPNYSSRR